MQKFVPMALAACIAVSVALPATSASAFMGARPAAGGVASSDVTLVVQQKQPKRAFLRKKVRFVTNEKPGTIIIDTPNKYLYYVEGNNKATRYGVGVGPP